MERIDRASRTVPYPPSVVYRALSTGAAVVRWLPPQGMKGSLEQFEPWAGGRVRLVLTYLDSAAAPGKTDAAHDVVDGTVTEVVPDQAFGFAVRFESADPAYAGLMSMRWIVEPAGTGSTVTFEARNVPAGIAAAEHEQGLASSLSNLHRYLDETG